MAFAALTIDINAKLANLESGLKRTEQQLEAFGSKAEAIGSSISDAFAAIGVGLSLGALTSQFSAAITELGDLDDAAEQTGSSVETISAALNTLRANGAGGLEQITELASRFGRAIQNVDKDTSKAAEAFQRLGLDVDSLKGQGRVDAILAIARAQAKLADDGNKAILVEAALGRGAAALIPQLNELAKTTASAATVTSDQAAAAESAAKQLAALQGQAIAFRNDIVSKILPGFNELLVKLRAFAEIGSAPGDLLATVFGDPAKLDAAIAAREAKLKELTDLQTKLSEDLAKATRPGVRAGLLDQLNEVNTAAQQEALRLNQLRALAQRRRDIERSAGLSADAAAEKPSANVRGLTGDIDDAAKAYKDFDAFVRQAEIDSQLKDEAELAKELAKQLDRAADAALKRLEAYDKAEQAAQEALGTDAERLRDSIDPTRALTRERQRIDDLFAAGQLTQDERNAALMKNFSEMDAILTTLPDKVEQTRSVAEELGLTFTSAFEDAVLGGKKLSDVLKGLTDDILRFFLRQQITSPLLDLLGGKFDASKSGGTLIGGLIGALKGGGSTPSVDLSAVSEFRAEGGPVSAGMPYVVGEKGAELIVPSASGYVVPNSKLGGATVVQNITVSGEVSRGDIVNAMSIAVAQAKREIYDSMQRRGAFGRA